ncbi:hypothetical protein HDV05_002144 [Chytridiales sp. JEL 0842]|nr:hypothetical protein HDV05_002144 [Chytridiales sp. JEL 0842]
MASISSTIASYGYSLLFGSGKSRNILSEGSDYVLVELVKKVATTLFESVHQYSVDFTGQVMSVAHAKQMASIASFQKADVLSDSDMALVLRYMEKAGDCCLSTDTTQPAFVKFRNANQKVRPQLDNVDEGVLKLKTCKEKLELHISEMEKRVETLHVEAVSAIKTQQKTRALFHLKLKKTIAENLSKKYASLQTLEAVLTKLQSVAFDAEFVKTMESGSEALKCLMAKTGLSADKVADIMDDLQSTLQESDEIETAILQGNESIQNESLTNVSDEELEAELEILQVEEQRTALASSKVNTDDVDREKNILKTLNSIEIPSTNPNAEPSDLAASFNKMSLAHEI